LREVDGVPLTLPTNVFTVTYTDPAGAQNSQAFTITIAPTAITPYIGDVERQYWGLVSGLTANYSDTVNLGPQVAITGGSWSWTGPGGFTSALRELDGVPLTQPTNVFTATYTNPVGVKSTQEFDIAISPTPIVSYLQVNGGAWSAASAATVAPGSTVNLGPQPQSGGSWSWTGPPGFTSTLRQINNIPLSVGTNIYVATYTNPAGVTSTQTFTITVN
jgi:hypothetical protein